MTLRQYVPNVGQTFKMREWNDYASRGIHIWAHLKVHAVVNGIVSFQVLNGLQPTDVQSSCELSAVQAPIGWEPRYTIHCKPEQTEQVMSWFSRGIVVRQSHNLSSSMPTAFQPMDNAAQPHWQFPEVTDAIPAELCANLFRVVSVEREEINPYSDLTGTHPNLRSMGRTARGKAIKAMRSEGWTVRYVPYAGGFWERQRETVVHNWQE